MRIPTLVTIVTPRKQFTPAEKTIETYVMFSTCEYLAFAKVKITCFELYDHLGDSNIVKLSFEKL